MKKISFSQLAIEFVSVVFAVLLALGLNSVKESWDRNTEAENLKISILAECAQNKLKVDSILINNRDYATYLDSLVQLPKEDQDGGFAFYYEFELLTKGAWEVAHNHPASSSLDPDFLLKVSDLYNMQDFFMDFSKNMVNDMGRNLSVTDQLEESDLILSMHFKVSVINTFAEELKTQYQSILTSQP